jgi:hypothetical protein
VGFVHFCGFVVIDVVVLLLFSFTIRWHCYALSSRSKEPQNKAQQVRTETNVLSLEKAAHRVVCVHQAIEDLVRRNRRVWRGGGRGLGR